MTGNLKLLINFIWKFLGSVRFGNDHVAAILGYGDLQWGNILITKVYFVEGFGAQPVFVGQFCDSDLEVAFRRNTCFVRNLEGVDLLKGNHTTNIYTINLHEMAYASLVCIMARATSTKSWLWHQRLSHLNFDTINDLTKNDLWMTTLVLLGYTFSDQKMKHQKRLIFFLKTITALQQAPVIITNREDIGKPGAKGDIGFFIGYSANSCAYRVYNRRTKKIMETMNLTLDELLAMAFEQNTTPRTTLAAQAPQDLQVLTTSTTTADTAPTPTNSSSQAANNPNTSQDVDELEPQQQHVQQHEN
ncbi:integrase, catalytic region, zinc finger, CCHC-type containing protein [Tanacetum coccineum]